MSLRQNLKYFNELHIMFSYQSECHCAKTYHRFTGVISSLVTSQNVTAPKPVSAGAHDLHSLVTSQNVTAPKQIAIRPPRNARLVTSQNVTAPKLELSVYARY